MRRDPTIKLRLLSVRELKRMLVLNDALPDLFDELDAFRNREISDLWR